MDLREQGEFWVPDKALKIFALTFVAVGITSLAVGAIVTILQINFLTNCSEATGFVVDFDHSASDVGVPVFKFEDSISGTTVTAKGTIGHSNDYSIGDKVSILYDPGNLSGDVAINSFYDIWFNSLMTLGVGSVMMLAGIMMLRQESQRR